jgi:hypothetical protein
MVSIHYGGDPVSGLFACSKPLGDRHFFRGECVPVDGARLKHTASDAEQARFFGRYNK